MYRVPMSSPDITEAERAAVLEVLESQQLSLGPRMQAFEEAVADFVGLEHAIAVSSGTAGLHVCVIAAGWGDNDLVITSPFSFVASANVLLYERCTPVFVDVDEKTGNIDAGLVAEAVADLQHGGRTAKKWLPRSGVPSDSGRTAGLLPVHAFGQVGDMESLNETAGRHGLNVVEDACEAIGSAFGGRPAGSWGRAGVFAFYPNKQITTGEGGVVVTGDEGWAALARSLRNQGRDVFDSWLRHSRLGYNYRLDEMSAALGVVQMKRIDDIIGRREQVAQWYLERLSGIEGIEPPRIDERVSPMSWFCFVVKVLAPFARDEVMSGLEAEGIPSRPYFSPIHLQPYFQERFGYKPGDFPVTERLGDTSLALPFSSVMTESQVDEVCEVLTQILNA